MHNLSEAGLLLQMVFNIEGHGLFLRKTSEIGAAERMHSAHLDLQLLRLLWDNE